MSDMLSLFFGKKRRVRRAKKSPGRRPKRGHYVKSLPKSRAFVTVRGRKRKLHRGANGGLYYRTKSGRHYIEAKVLKRRGHLLSPKKRRVRRAVKKLRRRKRRKLKMTKTAIAARRAYRLRKKRMSRFGMR
tara:strand:- start:1575 stop:1967 length:393 start_codon:yes stop_codon:yes gene_type:complete